VHRVVAALTVVVVLSSLSVRGLAHAGARLSDPLEGATLGDTPSLVRIYFSERPEPSLSSIRVSDTDGRAYQIGNPELVADDPLSLSVRVQPLPTGVYIVTWRNLSAVDGHATDGSYAFGVRATPAPGAARSQSFRASPLEAVARMSLIAGIVLLLGTAAGALARFGDVRPSRAAFGWLLAAVGVVLLGVAQQGTAAASVAALMNSSVGRALAWRAAGLLAAGVALAGVGLGATRFRRVASLAVLATVLGVVAVHVANGHAAAGGRWPVAVTLAAQWTHFATAGIWVGGLVVLLAGVRNPSAATQRSVRRFSSLAAACLVVTVVTGVLLTANVVTSWGRSWYELTSTSYGIAVLTKTVLVLAIAACAAFNRLRSLPAVDVDTRLLRLGGGLELTLMAGALIAASMLGTLPPPAGGAPPGLTASASDFGTTVRVRLTTPSDQPGPNRFVVEAVDYDTRAPIRASRVTLRFTALDDPDIAPTTLVLAAAPDNAYIGSGANLAFDGRWRIAVLIEGNRSSVEVPLEVETRGTPTVVSVERRPGRDPAYTVTDRVGRNAVRFSPHPEQPGDSAVRITFFDAIGDVRQMGVITAIAASNGSTRLVPVRRLDDGSFVATVQLATGRTRVGVVARALDGTRVRATVELDAHAPQ
jgi:putative copper export protein/methionine-rich copper-binding protein CopC